MSGLTTRHPIHQDGLPAGEFINRRIKINEEVQDFEYGCPQVKKKLEELSDRIDELRHRSYPSSYGIG
jgi:uncharacterized coiled-coil DUF342 family protein